VVDALNELPLKGRLGSGLQVLISPQQLEPARQLFYRADERTYGETHEFVLGTGSNRCDPVEYRIRIDNREYQHTLSGLQYLLRIASREGMAVWMSI
jgi:hypothetical protein